MKDDHLRLQFFSSSSIFYVKMCIQISFGLNFITMCILFSAGKSDFRFCNYHCFQRWLIYFNNYIYVEMELGEDFRVICGLSYGGTSQMLGTEN